MFETTLFVGKPTLNIDSACAAVEMVGFFKVDGGWLEVAAVIVVV